LRRSQCCTSSVNNWAFYNNTGNYTISHPQVNTLLGPSSKVYIGGEASDDGGRGVEGDGNKKATILFGIVTIEF